MKILCIRLAGRLMSFGTTRVGQTAPSADHPGLSMLTGLLGNALGWDHRDDERLQDLQGRIVYAVRQDVPGKPMRDYHTVDLGHEYMRDDVAWTTRGAIQPRLGTVSTSTHQTWREYRADAVYTVCLGLTERVEDDDPELEDLAHALDFPARTLFLGRSCCLPSEPLNMGILTADDVYAALSRAPLHPRARPGRLTVWWSRGDDHAGPGEHTTLMPDVRDWHNRIHVGGRWVTRSTIEF